MDANEWGNLAENITNKFFNGEVGSEWETTYTLWLASTYPDAGKDTFEMFLLCTERFQRFDTAFKQFFWSKAVQALCKRMGVRELDEATTGWLRQRLDSGQTPNPYDWFDQTLDEFRSLICEKCKLYDVAVCNTCWCCQRCCECVFPMARPFIF